MIISNINNIIIDTITEISRDLTELFAFSFELRKADSDNKYSYEFLNGAVNPPIIVQIIMNNHWDSRKKRMIVGEANYRLVISINQQRYTLCYLREKHSTKQVSIPFVLKEGNKVPKNMSASCRFTLCKRGILLGKEDSYLATM